LVYHGPRADLTLPPFPTRRSSDLPTQALHRELREELGVTVELGDELVGPDHGTWIITDRHVMRLWFARITAGEPLPLVEHDELRSEEHTSELQSREKLVCRLLLEK